MNCFVRNVVAGLALCASLACSADRPLVASLNASRVGLALSAVPIHPYGIGANQSPGQACSAPEYRQFDFWLGSWDVGVPGVGFAGTNIVERELDGCVVEENWTDGGRGRSMNTYDASDGQWHQHWVYSGGGPSSVLVLDGFSPGPGTLWMGGIRLSPAGAEVRDSITWTAITPDSVRQHWLVFVNGVFAGAFDGRYRRVAEVTPVPVGFSPTCTNRPANHQFDFLLGQWQVTYAAGSGAGLASSPVTSRVMSDLDHCLIEETVEGPGGYRGWSFSAYQPGPQLWHRTYVDNRGQRIRLTGTQASDGTMVLAGSKRTPDGREVLVRVTWEALTTDLVSQRWEYSGDGGATWSAGVDVRMHRSE
jgi:hypothetical protein